MSEDPKLQKRQKITNFSIYGNAVRNEIWHMQNVIDDFIDLIVMHNIAGKAFKRLIFYLSNKENHIKFRLVFEEKFGSETDQFNMGQIQGFDKRVFVVDAT